MFNKENTIQRVARMRSMWKERPFIKEKMRNWRRENNEGNRIRP